MKVRCPKCGTESEVPEKEHYKVMLCPKCGGSFHAVTDTTQQLSRAVVDEYLKGLAKKP
jgi:Zn finger protein HypA/HybF involved in hydrogenase expression